MEAAAREGAAAAVAVVVAAAGSKGGLARVLRVGPGPGEWVVACKAGGLFVHRNQWDWSLPPSERVYAAQLLQDHVDQLLATSHWGTTPVEEGQGKVHLVHRLDKPASGCLLAALSAPWAALLQRCMTHPSANKTYLAHVRGTTPSADTVEICKPLARNGRMKKSISVVRSLNPTPYATPAPPPVVAPAPADDASTPAVTKPARRVNTASSLFLVQIRTGRFHQVRRHCRFLSHPIIGDSTHGDLPVNHHWQSTTPQGYPRLGLHCFAIDIPLPTPERIAAYLQWWADKEKARAARRAEFGESWRERKLTPEEEVARLEDMGSRRAVGGAEGEEEADDVDKMDPELKEREEELEAILGLNTTTERLRALCPVPDDLRSVWERQEWWADAVTRLPSLGWTQEEIEVRARENDLYGAGWPIPREMPERYIVEDGHSKKTGTLTS